MYESTKAMPYVYFGINRITGELYIGYREANKLPSTVDLFIYRTSSKIVRPKFDEYDWQVAAEFFLGNDAYDFEQYLICENWGNPLLLNRQYRLPSGERRFKSIKGLKRGPQSDERKAVTSKALKGLKRGPQSAEHIAKLVKARKGKLNRGTNTKEHNAKISAAKKGVSIGPSKKSVCPHCGLLCGPGVMKQYHSDNCLKAPNSIPRQTVTCPHCNKEGNPGQMKRYHFSNCKLNKGIDK